MNLNSRKAFDTALKILSLRDHFENELVKKLYISGFEKNEIFESIEKLKRLNYINDERILVQIINEYKRKKKGINYIISKLYEKTGTRFEINIIREFYSLEEETENIKNIEYKIKSDKISVRKQKLLNRGFSFEAIKEALHDENIS